MAADITQPYPKSLFVPWMLIFNFLTPKSIFFLASYKTQILEHRFIFFWLWEPIFTFSIPISIYFLLVYKIFDQYIKRWNWFWTPNSVFGHWSLIFAFLTPNSILYIKYIYFFLLHVNFRSMDISHDHADFGTQIPFMGSDGLFLPLRSLKVYIFFIYIKFLIDLLDQFHFWALSAQPGFRRTPFFFSKNTQH
jgi:hypothetical protein